MPSVAEKRLKDSQYTSEDAGASTSKNAIEAATLAASLNTSSFDAIRNGLSALRSSIALASYDERLDASDRRIRYTKDFLAQDGLQHLHRAWQLAETSQHGSVIASVLHSFASLIALLSFHQPDHELAEQIISGLLPNRTSDVRSNQGADWQRLQAYLSDSDLAGRANINRSKSGDRKSGSSGGDITLAALHLIHAITSFQSSKYARDVFDAMPWGMKSLSRLANMRRRVAQAGKKNERKQASRGISISTLSKPDIRTMWTLVLLSFLRSPTGVCTSISLRVVALTMAREYYVGVLKGLAQDPAQIVTHFLMGLHDGLLSDEACMKLPRAKVVGLFNEWACKSLLELYGRERDEIHLSNTDERHSIADVVHHFMLALCTHPGRGVCYTDEGWYGRPQQAKNIEETIEQDRREEDETNTSNGGPNLYNKILLGLLRSLSPTRSLKQAELAVRILEASPELVGPYLSTFTNLTPKPTSVLWLSSSAFVCRVLALPLPDFESFGNWRAEPPSSTASLNALIPVPVTRMMLQRGFALQDKLAALASLTLLASTLSRLVAFKDTCRKANSADQDRALLSIDVERDVQEADIISGTYAMEWTEEARPWMRAWQDIVSAAKVRLPETAHILASIVSSNVDGAVSAARASCSTIREQALRCVWMLQEVLGSSNNVSSGDIEQLFRYSLDVNEGDAASDSFSQLASLHAMHAIRAIFDDHQDHMDALTRYSSTGGSALSRLLRIQSTKGRELLHQPAQTLLDSIMQSSVMFEHDATEWQVWQHALQRPSDDLIDFIDECAQRCMKTVYRYIEAARNRMEKGSESFVELVASPMLFTILEQFDIRMRKGLIKDSQLQRDIVVFLARLLPALSTQGTPCGILQGMMEDCADTIRNGKECEVDTLLPLLSDAALFLNGLQGASPVRTEKGNGSANGKSKQPTLSPSSYAIELLSASKAPRQIAWTNTSAIDAKLIIMAVTAKLEREPTCTPLLLQVALQCLAHGAFDLAFLSRTLFDGSRLSVLASTEESVNFLVDLLVQGPFEHDGEDVKVLSPLADIVIFNLKKGDTYAWSAACQLAPFFNEEQQNEIVSCARDSAVVSQQIVETLVGLHTVKLSYPDMATLVSKVDHGLSEDALDMLCVLIQRSNGPKAAIDLDSRSKLVRFIFSTSLTSVQADNAVFRLLSEDEACHEAFAEQLRIDGNFQDILERLPRSLVSFAEKNASDALLDSIRDICVSALFAPNSSASSISSSRILMKCVRRDGGATWSKLVEAVPVEPAKAFSHDALLLAALSGDGGSKGEEFAELLVQKSLLWLVRRFAEDDEDSEETTQSMEVLTKLLDRRSSLMERLAHLAGPVLTAGISRRLKSLRHAKFLCRLLALTPLEMNVRQKHLVDILCDREALNDDRVQHEIISTTTDCLGREPRSATLLVLKELSRSYTGSLSFKDRQILECVLKFEGRSEFNVELLSLWQSNADAPVRSGSTNSAALDTLDVNRVLDTCLHFPRNRSYRDLRRDGFDECVANRQKIAGQIYDPLFVLSVLGQFLAQEKVVTGFEMIDLLRTNALGCAVCCLSSRCALVRSAALALLCKAYAFVHAATFHEKEQLLLVFETLRNSAGGVDLVAHDCSLINPLPMTATLFVAHALRAQAQPSLYLYPLISRFMLQRATPLDRTDVPLLYSFLYASSQQSQTHRQQRIFIIRFMTSCLLYGGRTEWRTMKRRHVWHSLAAMYTTLLMRDNDQSGGGEQNLRRSIEEYWEAAMLREHAAIDVVARLGFLQYLQQTLVARDGDGADASLVSCQVRIIASLIQNCDIAMLEKATGGTIFDSLRELLIKLHGVKSPISTTLEQLLLPSRAAKKLSDHIKGMTSQDVGSDSACRCLSRWIDLIDQRVPLYQTTIEDREQELLNQINPLLKYSRSVLDSQGADTISDEGPLE